MCPIVVAVFCLRYAPFTNVYIDMMVVTYKCFSVCMSIYWWQQFFINNRVLNNELWLSASFSSDYKLTESWQPGLAGINLGKFLIKRVITLVKRDMPQVSVSIFFSHSHPFKIKIPVSLFDKISFKPCCFNRVKNGMCLLRLHFSAHSKSLDISSFVGNEEVIINPCFFWNFMVK